MTQQPQDWRRRQAIQIACQLPEYCEDALAVLRLAEELVTGFLSASDQEATVTAQRPIMAVVHRLEPRERV
ncbi:hypothetical protein [Bradyrhizobium sp. USDA 4473]